MCEGKGRATGLGRRLTDRLPATASKGYSCGNTETEIRAAMAGSQPEHAVIKRAKQLRVRVGEFFFIMRVSTEEERKAGDTTGN